MSILVTGGAGFVGSHLVRSLLADQENVTLLDNFEPQVHGPKPRVPKAKRLRVVKADIRDRKTLARELRRADAVVHLAAAVGVGQSQYQIGKFVDVNLNGTATLLDILANEKHRVRRLVVAGSMSSYGEGPFHCDRCGRVRPGLRLAADMRRGHWDPFCPTCRGILQPLPTLESDRFEATSIYAVTKMAQEELVLNYGTAYAVPSIALRFFNIYGPGQSLSNPYTGAAAIFMSRFKNGNPPVIYEDGLQSRDFVSVHDVVQAIRLSLKKSIAKRRVFNVGTGVATSILDLAKEIGRITGSKVGPKTVNKFRTGDIRHCYADIGAIRESLGYRPKVALADGLRELVDWAGSVDAKDTFDQAQRELVRRGLV
jgi:dTDP-L-rhamnose 4-epimerase